MKKKIALIAAAAAGAGAVGAEAASEAIFREAFIQKKKVEDLSSAWYGTRYEQEQRSAKRWLQKHSGRREEILSEDGLKLKAHYFKAEDPVRTVILCHGWRGFWYADLAQEAVWLLQNGCSLLAIEQRAQGASEGKYMTFGIRERRDVILWARWLNETKHPDKIYLVGKSMGAATVMMAAGDPDLPDNVAGVVADCGFASPYSQLVDNGRQMKLPEHPLMEILNRKCRSRIGIDLKEYSALDAMETVRVPMLFIHGMADTFVAPHMSLECYEACRSPYKRLLTVEGAGHCMSYFVDPEACRAEYLKLFAEGEKGKEEN